MKVQFWTKHGRAIIFVTEVVSKTVRSVRFRLGSGTKMTILRKDIISVEEA